MKPTRFSKHFYRLLQSAKALAVESELPSILLMLPACNDWESAKKAAEPIQIVVASVNKEQCASAEEQGVPTIELPVADVAIHELISIALLSGVADDIFRQGSEVVVMYSAYTHDRVDSISLVQMDEHLGRLTSRDLQLFETKVPLNILKSVVDLAVEIGREGREGKPVGTLFVVGNHRKVMEMSQEQIHDPFRGYPKTERSIRNPRVRESIKELAQIDGAFVISSDGLAIAAGRHLRASAEGLTLSKGLGSRHWAAAEISKATGAIAIAVSESTGTVRVFQDGVIVLRIEPMRNAMKWHDVNADGLAD